MTSRHDWAERFAFLKKTWIQDAFWIVPALSVFTFVLLNQSLSLSARTGFYSTVMLLFLLLYLAFRLRSWSGKILSLRMTLTLFALALAGLWATGQTQSTVLSGITPLYDTADYRAAALRLLAGAPLSP